MSGSHQSGWASSLRSRLRRGLAAALLVALGVPFLGAPPVSAAPLNYKIDLKVLVLDDGSGWVAAFKSQMAAEGVKFSAITLTGGTDFNAGTLASATEAFYQAVVVPSSQPVNLSAAERTMLRAFEAKFGVRQVDAWDNDINDYPNLGLNAPTYNGTLDNATATVTVAGKAAGFGYLNGPIPFSVGSFGHIAAPLNSAYTSLVDTAPPGGGTTGSIMGVYSSGGVEQMVITPGFGFTFLQFKYLAHGVITWMTRGVHFGYDRNSFTFHFDDAFAEDSLWDSTLNCTPGEDCTGVETTARMSAADVAYAVSWMTTNNFQLTLPFNGSHADEVPSLRQAFVDNKSAFRWINHGYQHIYQGCVQNFLVTPWVCTLDAAMPPNIVYVSQAAIVSEIQSNITKGNQLQLPFDDNEYLSGEHSGLQFTSVATPGQNQPDNPNFIAAMNQLGIVAVGSDASREPAGRIIGTATKTIPRHPTALYYNNATRAQAIDEYNWFYTTTLDGGTGTCGIDPLMPPCISPLLTDAQFDSYIVPTDATFDLGFILSNDPRPFYAHVTNLVGGVNALAYPLLDNILGRYKSVFTPATPTLNLTQTQAANELARQQQWATDVNAVSGFVQNGAISITNATGRVVPFTAPAGTTVVGNTLGSYGGESSAWLTAGNKTGTLPAPAAVVATGGPFVIGQAGSMTLAVANTPAATVTVSGTLPAGLTATPTQGAVTISGTPSAGTSGTYPLNVTVVTAGYNNVETATLQVARVATFTSATSTTAVAGSPFSFNVTTTNGIPAPALSYSGTLPAGVTFTNNGNGTATIAGTPAASAGGHSFPLTLTATNLAGATNQSFTLVVNNAPQFTSPAVVAAVGGVPFSFNVTTSGTPTATSITKTGALPAGLTFTNNGNGTATIAGTAPLSAVGQSFPITLTATNSAGVGNQSFTLTVVADASLKSISPARLADTRPGFTTVDGQYAGEGIRPSGSTLELLVAGRGGVPADATAAALNVTVAEPGGSGFVTVYPCGSERPTTSNLNYTAGAVVPNAVIAKLGDGGKVCLFVSNSTQLIVDVNGYFPSTSTFVSMNPARILETRAGLTTIDGLQQGEGIRGDNAITTLHVADRAGVPANASAVVLNVTVTEATGNGFVTVYPCGEIPTASNINYTTGATIANMVVALVDASGNVCLYNNAGTHLVVDVNGYFPGDGTYLGINPARLLETRAGLTTIDSQYMGAGLLPNGTVTELTVAGRGGVPANAKTAVLNVTVTEAAVAGYITVYPCGTPTPLASNLNYEIGSTVAIAVIAQIPASGNVCLFNSGSTQLIADVNGYLLN